MTHYMSVHTQKFLNKNFTLIIYFFSLTCSLLTLYYARKYSLLPRPVQGTDQLGILEAAANMSRGKLPDAGYMYSYTYTLFLYILHLLAQSSLIIMRVMQAVVCALIPVFIYKVCLRLRFGISCAQLSSLLYCFYGPSILISLSFLRAAPLALCFIIAVGSLAKAFTEKNKMQYFKAGLWMSMCILGRENFIPVAGAPALMLLYPSIRAHMKKSYFVSYVCGISALVIPVIIYNAIMFGSISLVPGHWHNVMGAYHSEATGNVAGTAASILSNIPLQTVNYLCSYEIPNSLSFYAHREVIEFLRIFAVPFNFFTSMSITVFCFRLRNKSIIYLCLMLGVYVASMLPFHMFYRFRIPTIPLVCCLSGIAIIIIIQNFLRKRYLAAILPLILFIFIFALTMRDAYILRPASEKRGAVLVLIQNKRFHTAELLIEKMPIEDIDTMHLKTYLLRELHRNGEKARAAALYQKWLKIQKSFSKRKQMKENSSR